MEHSLHVILCHYTYTIISWVTGENVPGSIVCILFEEIYLEKTSFSFLMDKALVKAYSSFSEVKFAKSSAESDVRPFRLR